MSAVSNSETSQAASSAQKKKHNKKKKSAKGKTNGDSKGEEPATSIEDDEQDVDDAESSPTEASEQVKASQSVSSKANGGGHSSKQNGHADDSASFAVRSKGSDLEESVVSNASDTTDASSRFEAMSQEREALRAEVEQLRKSLESIQDAHREQLASARKEHDETLSTIKEKHSEEVSTIKDQHTEELSTIRTELEESESAKEQTETQYQNLLGRVNTIKATLGERLKADKEELAEAKEQLDDLEARNDTLQKRVQALENDKKSLENESSDGSKELSTLRNRYNLSQQNWAMEREDLISQTAHLKDEADAAKEAMADWEVLAMEERSMRESLTERLADIEEQYASQKEAYEAVVTEKESQASSLSGLQRALVEVQEARKVELRELVESYEEQLSGLKKLVQESDARATEAEASKGALQSELERLEPFEKEVKEKNLLIGKLRHEAIVLNDHLTKALRFLKKAKPEDNIDRQIVTNHFLHFLALDRSDAKKFQILQLIASLLNWTDEQKEQAGLARPGTSNASLRLPTSPFLRTPSTPSLMTSDLFSEPPATKESLADLWTGFLERSAEEGSKSRTGSVSSASTMKPETLKDKGAK